MRILKVLNNAHCPYCGVNLRPLRRPDQNDPDHVIGRRFVPTGYLDGAWNLILDVCRNCNGQKSRLEGSVSAISHLTLVPVEEMPDDVREDLARK
jgi:hypothetical protein